MSGVERPPSYCFVLSRHVPVIALSIISLSKSFRAGTAGCSARVSVLRNLDLALWPGEIVALEGTRASGRTTLLACAAGALKPDAGAVFWLGARAAPPGTIAYARSRAASSASNERGALFAALSAAATPARTRLLLVDDLDVAEPIEQRLVLSLLQRHALAGAAVLFAASPELAAASLVTRAVALSNGALVQRRKRSAARIAASSRSSRARASARSTYGRSLRSPQ
jgi:energy-coupling factor transporter ATP-binding protein EcfA2